MGRRARSRAPLGPPQAGGHRDAHRRPICGHRSLPRGPSRASTLVAPILLAPVASTPRSTTSRLLRPSVIARRGWTALRPEFPPSVQATPAACPAPDRIGATQNAYFGLTRNENNTCTLRLRPI